MDYSFSQDEWIIAAILELNGGFASYEELEPFYEAANNLYRIYKLEHTVKDGVEGMRETDCFEQVLLPRSERR